MLASSALSGGSEGGIIQIKFAPPVTGCTERLHAHPSTHTPARTPAARPTLPGSWAGRRGAHAPDARGNTQWRRFTCIVTPTYTHAHKYTHTHTRYSHPHTYTIQCIDIKPINKPFPNTTKNKKKNPLRYNENKTDFPSAASKPHAKPPSDNRNIFIP